MRTDQRADLDAVIFAVAEAVSTKRRCKLVAIRYLSTKSAVLREMIDFTVECSFHTKVSAAVDVQSRLHLSFCTTTVVFPTPGFCLI
jgi:hypothetical protein